MKTESNKSYVFFELLFFAISLVILVWLFHSFGNGVKEIELRRSVISIQGALLLGLILLGFSLFPLIKRIALKEKMTQNKSVQYGHKKE